VSYSPISGTQTTQTHKCFLDGRTLLLFDTPGFDDTYRGDADILADIAENLSASYKQNLRLSGIVYLHRIKDERMTNAILRNLTMFQNLCGKDAFQNVTLATTFWDELQDIAKGESRELQLIEEPDWWGYMAQKGSRVRRFMNTRDSALKVLAEIAGLKKVPLQIQKEIVDEGKGVKETTAGAALNKELAALTAKHAEDLKRLKLQIEQAKRDHDTELQAITEKMQKDKQAIIDSLADEQEALNADRREELRRVEQSFSDQMLRLQRELQTKNDQEKLEFEKSFRQEREEIVSQFNIQIAQANQASQDLLKLLEKAQGTNKKEYSKILQDLKREREVLSAERQRWETERKETESALLELNTKLATAGAENRIDLEKRIAELESKKRSAARRIMELLAPLGTIVSLVFNILGMLPTGY
jgi:hypothetical protein